MRETKENIYQCHVANFKRKRFEFADLGGKHDLKRLYHTNRLVWKLRKSVLFLTETINPRRGERGMALGSTKVQKDS